MKLWHGLLLGVAILMIAGGVLAATLLGGKTDIADVPKGTYYLEWAGYYDTMATQNQQTADLYWELYLILKEQVARQKTVEEIWGGLLGYPEVTPEEPPISAEEARYKSEYYAQLAIEYRAEAHRYRALAWQ